MIWNSQQMLATTQVIHIQQEIKTVEQSECLKQWKQEVMQWSLFIFTAQYSTDEEKPC